MGLRCLASLTSTCSWPPLALRSDLEAADLILPPNLRRLDELPVRLEPRENIDDFRFSGGMYFRPTTMSPRYVATSSNGSLCGTTKKSIVIIISIWIYHAHLHALVADTTAIVDCQRGDPAGWRWPRQGSRCVQTCLSATQWATKFATPSWKWAYGSEVFHRRSGWGCVS